MVEFHTSSLLLLSRISHLPLTFFFSFHACVNKDYGAGGGEEVDEKKRGRKRVSISREERGEGEQKSQAAEKERSIPPAPLKRVFLQRGKKVREREESERLSMPIHIPFVPPRSDHILHGWRQRMNDARPKSKEGRSVKHEIQHLFRDRGGLLLYFEATTSPRLPPS